MARKTKDTTVDKVTETPEIQMMAEPTEEVKPTRRMSLQVDRDKLVPIMNATTGTYVHVSRRTGAAWEFTGFGAEDYMELAELIAIRSSSPKVLNEPVIIVLDDEAVEYLGLTKLYENVMTKESVENFFKLPADRMEEILKKSPTGMKNTLVNMAVERAESGKLDSVSQRAVFTKLFNIEFD